MTKEDLQQLCDLREEIAEIEMKIAKLSSRGSRIVSDKVEASMKDFPYTPTSVKITGFDVVADKNTRAQIMNKRMLLEKRRNQAAELETRITAFINSIPQSKIRRMVEYRYIDGYTWEKIGQIFHCDRTTAEKAVSKYLRENGGEN